MVTTHRFHPLSNLGPSHDRPPSYIAIKSNHLGHVLEDALDLQHLVEVRFYPVAPVHHLVAVARDLEALAGLGEANHGNIRQPHLRSKASWPRQPRVPHKVR